jgi:outer membrane protein OmpA-like peptidoglycan-associated protein
MNKKAIFSLIFIFAAIISVFSQNLIKNPSFEEIFPNVKITACEYSQIKDFNTTVQNWSSSNFYTADILTFNSIGNKNCFPVVPHTGQRMAGIITYHPSFDSGYSYDYHEHIRGEFKRPLEVGKTYTFELWLYSDDTLPARHLMRALGEKAKSIISVYANNFSVLLRESDLQPNDSWRKVLETESTPYKIEKVIDNKKGVWQKFQFLVQADKPYRYFFLGNFSKDSDTKTSLDKKYSHRIDSLNSVPPKLLSKSKTFWELKKRIAYYCIDDVNFMDAPPVFAKEATYTFKNLVFEVGKAKLIETSCAELDALFAYLQENPSLNINIEGHTDNTGSEKINQELSSARANTVRDYLIKKGITTSKMQTSGSGSAKPIAGNDSEDGRRQNRRVEVRFF